MPERRGQKTDSPEEIKTRERLRRQLALNRLRESADWWVMKDFILGLVAAQEKELQRLITSPEQQANHNFHMGVLAGLHYVLRAEETIEKNTPPT